MNAIWQIWPSHVSKDLVDAIIEESEKYPLANTSVGFGGDANTDQYRSSDIKWVNKYNANSKFIIEMLWNYGQLANRNVFGYNIDLINDIQYTTYKAADNGKYDWHHDTFWANPTVYDRKLSIIVQLSDPSEYEGGVFEIDKQYPQPDPASLKQLGTVLVIPAFLLHRVTPVTKGVRRSLVSWIEGPKFR